ncbi:MAG: fimbrial protein [Bdellovibrionota bacterium]
MKKLAVCLLLLQSVPVFAASSGTLLLQGTVAPVNDIVVTAVAGVNNALNIVGGQTNLTVANVSETSNDLLGYKIMMSSANAGELRNASDATKKTTYTLAYDTGSATAPTTTPTQVKNVSTLAGLTTNASAVKVNVTAYPTAPAGTYSDTVTLAIVGN